MKPTRPRGQCRLAAALAASTIAALAGCGTPGSPQPPSLNLPDRVTDLSAVRAGDRVTITWTNPKRNTDKLPLKTNVGVRVCRKEGTGECVTAGQLQLAPGADGSFTDTLPAALAGGSPRALSYFVELKNRNGRSAGLSDAAAVLAGQAPAPVDGLAAEVRKDGIVLRWNPDTADAAVRLRRTLLTPIAAKPHAGPLAPPAEAIEQDLIVESGVHGGRTLDQQITFGQTYEYRAQRVIRVPVEGQTVELAGEMSAPIRIEAVDVFPPAIPSGLAAVATAPDAASGTPASIDLSWQPGTEADLAGYEVYRREDVTPWQRISGEQPVAGPAFHDAHVLAGHTYTYGVSAVDQRGHESGRSAEAQETVPNP
jgi:hypothetical protein